MLIAPCFCSDRDGEAAHGEKLAMTAPNVMIADRRLNVAAPRATFECSIIASFHAWWINATLYRWFGGFSSTATEVSMM
jgi:hypothetical protein